jgi:hypothetical protein
MAIHLYNLLRERRYPHHFSLSLSDHTLSEPETMEVGVTCLPRGWATQKEKAGALSLFWSRGAPASAVSGTSQLGIHESRGTVTWSSRSVQKKCGAVTSTPSPATPSPSPALDVASLLTTGSDNHHYAHLAQSLHAPAPHHETHLDFITSLITCPISVTPLVLFHRQYWLCVLCPDTTRVLYCSMFIALLNSPPGPASRLPVSPLQFLPRLPDCIGVQVWALMMHVDGIEWQSEKIRSITVKVCKIVVAVHTV